MAAVKVRKLFIETEKVVSAYKERVSKLDQQELELNSELVALQDELTANILDQETAGVAELVYLKIAAKEINHKTEIIQVLLEEVAEEKKALKLEFTPIYRTAIQKDRSNKAGYGATEIVEKYKYLMLTEISDIGAQMQEQYRKIAPDIREVFEDEAVRQEYRRIGYAFQEEEFKPSFEWMNNTVISKNEVFGASRGFRPKKPKSIIEAEAAGKGEE
jgi:hypothetical protein